jgi:hypothetical protein
MSTEVLICTGCEREIACCTVCDEEGCGLPICSRCVRLELREEVADPHPHGG